MGDSAVRQAKKKKPIGGNRERTVGFPDAQEINRPSGSCVINKVEPCKWSPSQNYDKLYT